MNRTTVDTVGRLSEERQAALEAVNRANQAAREHWGDPAWHREMAAEITETIYWGFKHENVLQLMSTVENVGKNDRITVRDVRGLRAFWVSLGGYIEQSTLREASWELPKDIVGFHVSEEEDKMEAEFVVNSTDIATQAISQMDAAVNQRFIRLLQKAIPSTSPYYVSGAGVGLPALDAAIDEVMDETEDEFPAIIGRARMVNQIQTRLTGSGLFLPETNEQIIRTGVMGVYRGCRIIKLINYRDDANVSFFPGNELYIAGRDASKFGFWGGLETKEWNEEGGWYWHLLGRRLAGGAVYRPERARRFVDTSLPA